MVHGVCVWFTGLSGSGKTVTAQALADVIASAGRPVTMLDGDVLRTHAPRPVGFTRVDREEHLRRVGRIAADVVRHHGIAICATISPYQATTAEVRGIVGRDRFVEVYVNTPLEVCERRDPKGLYARARRGEIAHFTGISDPYEVPLHPEIVLDGVTPAPHENADRVARFLAVGGWLGSAVTLPLTN